MEVDNKFRVRTIQIDYDADDAPGNNIDKIDSLITKNIEYQLKEGFKVQSMTSLSSSGTTYAVVIVFELAK
jgi:multidrug efflux pump subunit AcrB